MHKLLLYGVATLVAMLFAACGHKAHDDDHDHSHETAAAEAHDHEHGSDEVTLTAEQIKAAGLTTETVRPGTFRDVIEVSGRILPAPGAEATVTATMAGLVSFAAHNLTEGAPVSSGQALFTLNARPMADGNPAAVAQAELRAARAALDRAERLAKERIISQRELEDARQRYEAAAATAHSLGSAAQTRGATAPIGGFIKELLVKPGDYVSAGQALATVTQSRRVQLRADVPERYFGLLGRITSANFRLAYDEQHRVFSVSALGGRLLSKGQTTEADGFSVPVTFEMNNAGGIVSGSFAEVWLLGAERTGVISLPAEAVTEAQGLYFVYIQTHPGTYRRQEVSLGATDGSRVEVTAGLSAGDQVVVKGATFVRLAAASGAVPEGHSH